MEAMAARSAPKTGAPPAAVFGVGVCVGVIATALILLRLTRGAVTIMCFVGFVGLAH